MEKISLYDLLSILLPGALLTLAIEVIINDFGLKIDSLETNNYFKLTLFLSSSIYIGSLINISTKKLLKIYKKIGLFTPLKTIYKSSTELELIKPFLKKKMNSLAFDSKKEKLEQLWSVVYYELEATGKISSPKAFQSFYFFFRNFFTLGIILFLPLLFQLMFHCFSPKYIFLCSINVLGLFLSISAAKWNRVKMVERIFWTYYSLNKNK